MQDFVFRKALPGDIAACAHIYDRIIEEQDKGGFVVGWVHGIYPTAETAEAALKNDELFVCEYDGKVVASGIINKTQVDIYAAIPWRGTRRRSLRSAHPDGISRYHGARLRNRVC